MIVTKIIAQAVRVHGGPGGEGGASSASLMEKYFSQVSSNILSTFPVYFLALILKTPPSDVVTLMQLIMIYKLMRINCKL